MIFASFATNCEDVLLWRALKSVIAGVYIDIGATDPDHNSCTRAFYERGWRGINIASDPANVRPLSAARLRDITLDRSAWYASGRTPGSLLGEAVSHVHFVRLYLSGDGDTVDSLFDLSRCRPWILVVGGVADDGRDGSASSQILLVRGYVAVWFDGINRFYVAEEMVAQLSGAFATPPNSLDDFVSADSKWLVDRLTAAEARANSLAEQARTVNADAREIMRLLMETRSMNDHHIRLIHANEQAYIREHAATAQRLEKLSLQLAEEQSHSAAQERRAVDAEHWERILRQSTSWRLTSPLRYVINRLARRPEMRPPATLSPRSPVAAVSPAPKKSVIALLPQMEASPPPPTATVLGYVAKPAMRTVHQFHPGSARGDAITSAMRLIRSILRDLGYVSEIYCDRVDPVFEGDLRPMNVLPQRADYVLLVHFSLGFDKVEQILALPAPKVLMYHNITPPEFLSEMRELQELATLGYEQLALWRDHVAAALAVSQYNALQLRARGFDMVRCCPLLFDLDDLQRRAGVPPPRPALHPFTVLFVGRLVESKGQQDLLEAFAIFRRAIARPCRLVLVGHGQEHAEGIASRLRARAMQPDLNGSVVFSGVLDENGLHQAYWSADLYVSLSRHEGFGVTLIEAMVHGLPVLAWPCGAIPDTLGGTGELLVDREPAAVAARILALANDATLREAIVRRQTFGLRRFRLNRQVPVLLKALALAGAALPEDRAARDVLRAGLSFQITGHVNGTYSLAAVTRVLARSIEATRSCRVRLLPVEGEPTVDLSGIPAGEQHEMAALVARPRSAVGPIVVISHHYPVYVPADRGDVCMALFFWEESLIPMATTRLLNSRFHGVLATSAFVAKVLVDSGVSIPVHQVGHAPMLEDHRRIGHERRGQAGVRNPTMGFLHVSSCLPRKGVDVLLVAFARAFRRSDPVRLVIKGYPNPHNLVPEQLDALRALDPDLPEIVLANDDLDRTAMLDLFREADVMVLPTRGEGFNLPAAEALAAGLKLIVTGFGGHMDFCSPTNARLLNYRMARSDSHLASGNSLWAEPSVDDLVVALHEARSAWEQGLKIPRAQSFLSDAAVVERIEAAALDCLMAHPRHLLRVGWVTSWDVRCGVAEYTRHLVAAWPHQPACEHVILTDARPAYGAAADRLAHVTTLVSWEMGGAFNPHRLIENIARQDPDVLVMQHQSGLMSWPFLGRVLASWAASDRAVAVTLHSTETLAGLSPDDRQDAVAGLQRVGRVIVHTVADIERLRGHGIAENVVLMPHGVPEAMSAGGAVIPRLRSLVPSATGNDAPVIGCYGFFLPGKGIPELIEAIAMLRRSWPGARLRLVDAAYGTPESDAEILRCRTAVAVAGLDDAVEFHIDFLPDSESRDLLAGCDLVVLAYQSSGEASSAALRSALATCVPVAVTPLAVFEDAEDAVWRFDGVTPDLIAAGIDHLLSHQELRVELQARADSWKARHRWVDIAERMDGLLRGLVQERRIAADAKRRQ